MRQGVRMKSPEPLPPGFGGVPFDVGAARRAGVSRERLRRRDIEAPSYGVRVPIGATDLWSRARAYASRMPPQCVLAGATAAGLLEVPLPRRLESDDRLHVVSQGGRAPRGRGIVGSTSVRTFDIWTWGDLRVTDPITTWMDLAPLLSLDELVVAGDFLVGLPRPLTTMRELDLAVSSCTGRRGAAQIVAAHRLIRPNSRSPRETMSRLALWRAELPDPELNTEIVVDGRSIHGDFVFRAWCVLVEYEGDHHRTDPDQWAKDLRRYNDLVAAGWLVIRASRHMPPAELVTRVGRALRSRGWTG